MLPTKLVNHYYYIVLVNLYLMNIHDSPINIYIPNELTNEKHSTKKVLTPNLFDGFLLFD